MIRFVSFVVLLDALVQEKLLVRDPNEPNNILVRIQDDPDDVWYSENIFTLAQELFDSKEQRKELFGVIREKGLNPLFSMDGDFIGFEKRPDSTFNNGGTENGKVYFGDA